MVVISKEMISLLNYRIEQEEASSRLYKAMSVWLDFHGYAGAASLWQKYSNEECVHAGWAYQFLLNLNIKPIVPAIVQPVNDYKGLPQIVAKSLTHEIDITKQCNELAVEACNAGEFLVMELALRYVKEQVEELAKTQFWVDQLESFGDDKTALRLLDTKMGG